MFYSVSHQALASALSLMGNEIDYQGIEDIYGVIGVRWGEDCVCANLYVCSVLQSCMFIFIIDCRGGN